MSDLIILFCNVDDFWKQFREEWERHLLNAGRTKRGPEPELSISEMMTIVILFHQSNFRSFKHFYGYICQYFKQDFPKLICYERFVQIKKTLFVPLFAYLLFLRGKVTGIAFIDSTSIAVCHNKRIRRNKVFKNLAQRGKTTSGWFYGFKLHLIINDRGEILAFQLTQGNVSDISMVDILSQGIMGKLFGDKGYISAEIGQKLFARGLELFTTIKSNMKQKLMSIKDKILLRKRSLIETVNDQLKNISQIEQAVLKNSVKAVEEGGSVQNLMQKLLSFYLKGHTLADFLTLSFLVFWKMRAPQTSFCTLKMSFLPTLSCCNQIAFPRLI